MKIIEIVTTFSYQPLVKEILEQENLKECWVVTGDGKSQLIMQLLVTPERYQSYCPYLLKTNCQQSL
jgi:hypothetical protein